MFEPKSNEEFFRYPPSAIRPHWVPVAKRIRARLDGEYVADSQRVMLRRGFPLVYFFPRYDINMELLEKGDQKSESDEWGKKVYWHIKNGSRTEENGAWSYEKPARGAPENLKKYMAFRWSAMEAWLEEEEEVIVHPRDPYVRIDVSSSSRHVRIAISGETIAETRNPVLLFETGLPARYYIPRSDVKMDLLEPTGHHTGCPYKGTASYFSVNKGDEVSKNLVWTYSDPYSEVSKIKGLLAFYTERLEEVYIDGRRLPGTKTRWG